MTPFVTSVGLNVVQLKAVHSKKQVSSLATTEAQNGVVSWFGSLFSAIAVY